ncbi:MULTISPECIES: replication-associated recombination protein A [Bacillota]|jgi:putative ATPase|uniref:Replication-associated recombination protein A n=2 Tax=Amedibacillus TaxID=2749846 RepID=A0A7G9GSA5_9FIRM|nr:MULTISPECIES: replication-associated recombination protein A [Bacillota]QNM13687.1 replication-associated recombination protein A [[Eubacterium] hominis]MCH4283662.1 replication-associated recombination protein A [Amedibacillus hominis]RGB56472.1 replication-associated recombination protein A [Absiella sp. AM10-20]RGB56635.1 replication-associated recombination protein A [Absiella sp. AM22-9]RGB64737.1 replication-associated recombination protein A [Absiella sp. AM09-45]
MKQPLAFRMRPQHLDDIIGQQHLIGEGKVLRKCLEAKRLFSMIFYGPPGTGKTTLAMVLANELGMPYRLFNAVTGNKKDLETIFQEAKFYEGLVVIIDEVHRLNKDKQDLLLPHVENGNITLIGATTSNPLHAINPAIRSRCHLFEIKQAQQEDIEKALLKAIQHPDGLNNEVSIEDEALHIIARHSNGDIRYALNILEIVAIASDGVITKDLVSQYSQIPNMSMDSDGDGYYDVLSGFQKSIRGSDVDAALYYLGIMIEANDMDSIERRLLVTAYEDIGLGNPAAVARCVQAIDAAKRVGFPEGRIPLAMAVIDLTLSPKSKSAENAIDAVMQTIRNTSYSVPDYLRFTPVNMKEEDKYDYGRADLWAKIQYLPDKLKNEKFYMPQMNSSYEKVLAQNLEKLRSVKRTNKLASLKKNTK